MDRAIAVRSQSVVKFFQRRTAMRSVASMTDKRNAPTTVTITVTDPTNLTTTVLTATISAAGYAKGLAEEHLARHGAGTTSL